MTEPGYACPLPVILSEAKNLFYYAQIRVPGYKWLITGSLSEAAAGSDAVVNDSPVGCQSRGVTEPAGESCHRR